MKFNLIKKLDKKKTKTYFFRIFLLFVIFLIYYFPVKSNNNLSSFIAQSQSLLSKSDK